MKPFKGDSVLEFAGPGHVRKTQEDRLRRHLAWCSRESPYYRRVLADYRVNPRVATLDSLAALPFTSKSDFAGHNDDFLAVKHESIVDIVLSSGTTGKPTRVMYTDRDLQRLAYNEQMSFAACGITSSDVALLTCTMDRCFVAGLAYFLGIRALGAAAIRNGHGTLASHFEIIKTIKPTVLVGVPSFLRKLALYINSHGLDARETSVRKLVCIGEPVRGQDMGLLKLGRDLGALWDAEFYSTYASSECITTFCECTARRGGHLHPDLAIMEIVNEYNRPVPPGQVGELVLTPLDIEGMPLVRFKTGDISFMMTEPCSCGRTSPRLGPILGRNQQMMKIRGTSLYPQGVFAALDEIADIGDYYLEITHDGEMSDELTIHLGERPGQPDPELIRERLQACLRVTPRIVIDPEEKVRQHLYSPESRKPVRVFDRRKIL
jgi:phenylacetate-CoA ligase